MHVDLRSRAFCETKGGQWLPRRLSSWKVHVSQRRRRRREYSSNFAQNPPVLGEAQARPESTIKKFTHNRQDKPRCFKGTRQKLDKSNYNKLPLRPENMTAVTNEGFGRALGASDNGPDRVGTSFSRHPYSYHCLDLCDSDMVLEYIV